MSDPQSASWTKTILKRKALGFIQAIEKMGTDERTRYPSGTLAKDYNHLLQLIDEHAPSLKQYLPPPMNVFKTSSGKDASNQTFSELLVLSEQLYELLRGLNDTSDSEKANE